MELLFIRFLSPDKETTEATATRSHNNQKLAEGLWSVLHADLDVCEIMSQNEMPDHWRSQLKAWNAWSEVYARRRGFTE